MLKQVQHDGVFVYVAVMIEVPSPCINICDLDESGEYCLGCGRSLDEIAAWGGANNEERRQILTRLPERLARLKT